MRMLVLADTHGFIHLALQVLKNRGPWDEVVHLGDCVEDALLLEKETGQRVLAVRGNNEYPVIPSIPLERVVEMKGLRIYMTHGHTLDINPHRGDEHLAEAYHQLYQRASELNAQVILFGHTHQAVTFRMDGLLFLNPGGLGLGDQKKTYGVISVEAGKEATALVNEV